MVLGLIVLSVVFYLRPAADRTMSFAWWNWILLGALFFTVVGLHNWRRRRRGQAALHDAIRERAGISEGP